MNSRRWGWIAACGATAMMLAACGGGGSGSSSGGGVAPPPSPPPASPPVITGPAAALPPATAGSAATGATIVATGTAPITFAITAGSLPEGMALSPSTGVIAGTPLVSGAYPFTVTAANTVGSASAQFSQFVDIAPRNATLLLENNRLISFNASVPTDLHAPISLTGLPADHTIVAIARRPSNGFLYGIGRNGSGHGALFALHPQTFAAVRIGITQWFLQPNGVTQQPITGMRFGMNVSPSADVARVVSDAGNNFRYHLDFGSPIDGNGIPFGFQMDDSINGPTTAVDGAAYTDKRLGVGASTLYTIDSATDALCIQTPPNSGTQTSCLPLSTPLDQILGFDIASGINSPVTSGSAHAIVRLPAGPEQRLAQIDLTNGAVSASPPQIGTGGIRSLALHDTQSIPMYALNQAGSLLYVFSSTTPGATTVRTISGVNAGEQLVGIDFRPATGQLYALGIDAAADVGTLYVVELRTGGVVALGTGAVTFDDNGNPADFPNNNVGYGLDFNPATDQIRVTTGNRLNFRISASSGFPIDGRGLEAGVNLDFEVNPPGANVPAIAYTNGADVGEAVTTPYAISVTADDLCILSSTATTTHCLPLTLGGVQLELTALAGFDIHASVRAPASGEPVGSGVGFMAATLFGGATHLFEVNLVTGVVTDRGLIGDGSMEVSGFAMGR